MKENAKPALRCAIYTRKSTERGLELEFNSLQAQREACEAYIKSQQHEGWKLLPRQYDDAAYSGGSLQRPAVQQLLADIAANKIDVIVVYKIDRLTRSLADFAKLVELFDQHKVSFVAVTQQFNTTTSMGRLTLNVLLSFAQFERELASERVRDKITASRKRGQWTGGPAPLGYDVQNKKLIINPREAATVRYIFQRYCDLGCLRLLAEDLERKRIKSKTRVSASGRRTGGFAFRYGALAYLLKNRIYIGDISHKGDWHRGEHQALLDMALFDQVQEMLRTNSVERRRTHAVNKALLTGVIFDDRGHRMSPSFTVKNGVRYRFYISTCLLRGKRDDAGSLPRIAAALLEAKVIVELRNRITSAQSLVDSDLVALHVDRLIVSRTKIEVLLKENSPQGHPAKIEIPWNQNSTATTLIEPDRQKVPNLLLVTAITSAHQWLNKLERESSSVEALASALNQPHRWVRKRINLAFLAPAVTETILAGEHSSRLKLETLHAICGLSWQEQNERLKGGFLIT